MKNLVVAMILFVASSLPVIAGNQDAPAEFRTAQEARKWVSSGKGFGEPNFFETEISGAKVLVGWVDPFSGRSAEYAYAYAFDSASDKWVLLDASFIDKKGPISFVYFDANSDELVFVDRKGRKFKKVPVARIR